MTQTALSANSEVNELPGTTPTAPPRNAAVKRCCAACEHSLQQSAAEELSSYTVKERATQAYLKAIPHLCGYESVCDFIACVTHGMILDVISSTDGAKFLYAAQVAIGALRLEPKEPKQKKRTPTPLPRGNRTVAK